MILISARLIIFYIVVKISQGFTQVKP